MAEGSKVPWRKTTQNPPPITSTKSEPTTATIPWTKIKEEIQPIENKKWQADIMFAIDCTGSMGGEIEGVKTAVIEFANIIHDDGISIRLGLLEYRDRLNGEEPTLHTFNGSIYTKDINQYRETVALLRSSGGGPEPESTLDAILLAMKSIQDISRTNALVVITDAPPHIPDKECKGIENIRIDISEMKLDQLYIMYPLEQSNCSVYSEILDGITGKSFDLRGSKDTFYDSLISLSHSISTNTRFG